MEQIRLDDTLLTVRQVSVRLNMHVDAARRLIYQGLLTAFYVGGRRLRVTERHLQEFLRTQVKRA